MAEIFEDKTSVPSYRKHMVKYTDEDSVRDIFNAVIECSNNQSDGGILIGHADFFDLSIEDEVEIDIDGPIRFTNFVDDRNDEAIYNNINDKFAEVDRATILVNYDFIDLDEMFERMIRHSHATKKGDTNGK